MKLAPWWKSGYGTRGIHRSRDLADAAAGMRARRSGRCSFAQPHHVAGHCRFHLRGIAGDREFLLETPALGEHAQVERAAHTVRELDDHERIVEDVGPLDAPVDLVLLVEVVDVLAAARHHPHRTGAGDEVHQVEEVAALLHERATGVAAEPVPVADLLQERVTVLADRHHPRRAADAGRQLVEHGRRGGHEPVLQAHPRDRVAFRSGVHDPLASSTVVHSGFSISTCLSVANASASTAAWVWLGLVMITTSTFESARRSRWSR